MDDTLPAGHWAAALDTRMRQHADFARLYARSFAHGAPGHLDLMLIAAMAQMLDNSFYRGSFTAAPPATAPSTFSEVS
jgi:hypothetical protein